MNLATVIDTAGPKPPCFPSQKVWKLWLISEYEAGGNVIRRTEQAGKSVWLVRDRDEIDYCQDCLPANRMAKQCQGLCVPPLEVVA